MNAYTCVNTYVYAHYHLVAIGSVFILVHGELQTAFSFIGVHRRYDNGPGHSAEECQNLCHCRRIGDLVVLGESNPDRAADEQNSAPLRLVEPSKSWEIEDIDSRISPSKGVGGSYKM